MWLPGRCLTMALAELLRSRSSDCMFWRAVLSLAHPAGPQRPEDPPGYRA